MQVQINQLCADSGATLTVSGRTVPGALMGIYFWDRRSGNISQMSYGNLLPPVAQAPSYLLAVNALRAFVRKESRALHLAPKEA